MSSSDWWARKLGTPVQPAPVMPQVPLAQPQPAVYVQPQQPQYPPSQQVVPQSPRCPGCGSGNYGGPSGYKPRCYDCGYPIEQSGSGLGKGVVHPGASSAGPATPAKQIATGKFDGRTPVIGADGGFK